MTLPFCFAKKLDALEKISVASFCIIGLTKIPKIEFLLLDWIYCSIRIMTVADICFLHSLLDVDRPGFAKGVACRTRRNVSLQRKTCQFGV